MGSIKKVSYTELFETIYGIAMNTLKKIDWLLYNYYKMH